MFGQKSTTFKETDIYLRNRSDESSKIGHHYVKSERFRLFWILKISCESHIFALIGNSALHLLIKHNIALGVCWFLAKIISDFEIRQSSIRHTRSLGRSSHRPRVWWSKYNFDRLKVKQWVAGLDLVHSKLFISIFVKL